MKETGNRTDENATNHSLNNERPKWQLCDGTAPARGGGHCQADGQAHPQQVHPVRHHHLHQLGQVLVDLPAAGLPAGADRHWAFHSGHLARSLGALWWHIPGKLNFFFFPFWAELWTNQQQPKDEHFQSLLGEDRMTVGFICFTCGFVVGLKRCVVLKIFAIQLLCRWACW